MNVGKATDGMLDTISLLRRNRDETLAWIVLYRDAGIADPEMMDFLAQVVKGEASAKAINRAEHETNLPGALVR